MTTQRTVGSKPSARSDRARIARWAKHQLAVAQRATTRAVREHLAAGRAVVFEKDGKLLVKAGQGTKPRPVQTAGTDEAPRRQHSGFAESRAPKYITLGKAKKRARSKRR